MGMSHFVTKTLQLDLSPYITDLWLNNSSKDNRSHDIAKLIRYPLLF